MKINTIDNINFRAVLYPVGLTFSPQQKIITKEIKLKMDKKSEKNPEKTYNQILEERHQGLLIENGETNDSVKISIVDFYKKDSEDEVVLNCTIGDNYKKNQFNPQKVLNEYNEIQRNINALSIAMIAFVTSIVGIASVYSNKSNDDKTVIQSEQGDTFEKTIKDSTLVLQPEDFEENLAIEK